MPPKRILYIEDNFQNRRLVKKLLKLNGYEYLEAEDGLQGIAVAARERPDLILMDINLPGIDGMEATSRLKSSSDLSEIPIIALTAAAMRGDRERIMAAGCDGYLQKPINTVEVIDTIKSFVGESTLEPQTPPIQTAVPSKLEAITAQPTPAVVPLLSGIEAAKTAPQTPTQADTPAKPEEPKMQAPHQEIAPSPASDLFSSQAEIRSLVKSS